MATIFPPATVKLNTTRGRPPGAQTAPAASRASGRPPPAGGCGAPRIAPPASRVVPSSHSSIADCHITDRRNPADVTSNRRNTHDRWHEDDRPPRQGPREGQGRVQGAPGGRRGSAAGDHRRRRGKLIATVKDADGNVIGLVQAA